MSRLVFSSLGFLTFIAIYIAFVGASPLISVTTTGSSSETSTSTQSGDSSGPQEATGSEYQDGNGPFDVTLVSGFYGPGAFVSWILIAISAILDKAFESNSDEPIDTHRDSSNEDSSSSSKPAKKFVYGQILGLDTNLLSTFAYPCIAAVNASLYFRKLSKGPGGIEPDDVARLAAPLAALRTWNTTLGAILVAAWAAKLTQGTAKSSGKTFITLWSKGFRIRRDIIAVLLWVSSLSAMRLFFLVVRQYNHMSAVEWEYVEFVVRASPESPFNFEPAWYAAVMIGIVGYFIYFVLETGASSRQTRMFYIVFGIYVLCYIIGASFDIILCTKISSLEIPEQPEALLLGNDVTSFYSVMNLRFVNQEKGIDYFRDYFTRIQSMKGDFKLLQENFSRVWGIAEELILSPASILQFDLWPVMKFTAAMQVVLNWSTIGILGVIVLTAILAFIVPGIPFLSKFVSEDTRGEIVSFYFPLLFSVLYGTFVCDVAFFWILSTTWLQVLFPIFRPDLLVPASASGWADLDQLAALVLNGLVPLVFSLKASLQSFGVFVR